MQQFKIGDKVYSDISKEPYVIEEIFYYGMNQKARLKSSIGERVLLVASMQVSYTIVGSARDVLHRESCHRHGWKVWSGT